ncbi:MAG: hypothetical protein ABEI74_04620 [Candidatus Pacearchaeota archaeon]
MKKRLLVFALMFVLSLQFAFAATTSFDVVTLPEKGMTVTFYSSEDPSMEGFETYDNETGDGIFSFKIESEDVSKFDIKASIDGPRMDSIVINSDDHKTGKCYNLEIFQDAKDLSEKPCPGENNESQNNESSSENSNNDTVVLKNKTDSSNNESSNNSSNESDSQTSTKEKQPNNQKSFLSGFLTSGSDGSSNNGFFKKAFYVIAGILVLWIILFIFRTVLKKKEDKSSGSNKKVKVTKLSDLKSKLEKDRQKVSENKRTLNESIKEAEESIEKAQEAIYNLRKQQEGKNSDDDSNSEKSDKKGK